MPFIEGATVGPLPELRKGEMARLLTDVFTTPNSPAEWVTMVFRHIDTSDYAVGGRFVHVNETADAKVNDVQNQRDAIGPVMLKAAGFLLFALWVQPGNQQASWTQSVVNSKVLLQFCTIESRRRPTRTGSPIFLVKHPGVDSVLHAVHKGPSYR
jgi:phenylpyruvate tautomerase PptA (4-oxalocrotonate tautomerase family)